MTTIHQAPARILFQAGRYRVRRQDAAPPSSDYVVEEGEGEFEVKRFNDMADDLARSRAEELCMSLAWRERVR